MSHNSDSQLFPVQCANLSGFRAKSPDNLSMGGQLNERDGKFPALPVRANLGAGSANIPAIGHRAKVAAVRANRPSSVPTSPAVVRANHPSSVPTSPAVVRANHPGRVPTSPAVVRANHPGRVPTSPAGGRLREIAALFVSRRSIYQHLPGVDAFDRTRNAKSFKGGKPGLYHPPCRCWSKLRHQVTLSDDAKRVEMDLGKWAVEMVMKHGGVLEQPAGSLLWDACQLPGFGDTSDPFCFTLYVEQSWFGFPTPKPTWLLVCGVPWATAKALLPDFKLMSRSLVDFSDLNSFERSRTMRPFAEWLCQLARSTWWNL